MSRSARLGIVLAAVVVLVVGFVVLGNANDDSPSSPVADVVTTTSPEATPNPQASAAPSETTATTTSTAAEPAAPAEPTIAVRGRDVSSPKTLKFSGGERVRFRVTSDEPVEVHVHGYDVEEEAAPGAPAEFSFAPKIQGAYEIELHGGDEVQIGTLEVAP